LRKSEIGQMPRRLLTDRAHAERHGDILRSFGVCRMATRSSGALQEAGGKLKKVTRIVEAARLQRECCNREADPALPLRGCPSTLR
jgi:hypothetical protein